MGRYYNTNSGRGGKFGFGCQSSSDPRDFFGMIEQEPNTITYWAEDEDYDGIKEKLDEVYNQAKVPQEERIYELFGGENEYQEFHDKFHKYFFEPCENGNFAGENGTEKERFANAHLGQSRLWLGLVILTDPSEDGYCELDAEL